MRTTAIEVTLCLSQRSKTIMTTDCCNGTTRRCTGPGYASPIDAMKNGPREKILYTTCIRNNVVPGKPDYLATIDVDPASKDYCKVIHRLEMPNVGDEIHHSGWNACSSCYDDPTKKRSFLVLPCLVSDRVYIVDMADQKAPVLHKVLEGKELREKTGQSAFHTSHCLGTGEVMISSMGDDKGVGKGGFTLVEEGTFKVKGVWQHGDKCPPLGYSFWYQPYHNVMISTEWVSPNSFLKGFSKDELQKGAYGTAVNIWNWNTREFVQRLDLGYPDGLVPMEVRFLHDPLEEEAYVGCSIGSCVYRLFKKPDGTWDAEKVIKIPWRAVTNWMLPEMPALISDTMISLDDRFLYINCWLQGDIRQYDITNRSNPKLVGQVFLSGSMVKGGKVKPIAGLDKYDQPEVLYMKGRRLDAGPQMMQLSLDGKRLYVTSSLMSVWDTQFYPEMIKNGAYMLQIDVDTVKGGLTLNRDFFVDFGKEPGGPALAHETRYPGGDCTSEIWLADCCTNKS